jgi:hypothetical protein
LQTFNRLKHSVTEREVARLLGDFFAWWLNFRLLP